MEALMVGGSVDGKVYLIDGLTQHVHVPDLDTMTKAEEYTAIWISRIDGLAIYAVKGMTAKQAMTHMSEALWERARERREGMRPMIRDASCEKCDRAKFEQGKR